MKKLYIITIVALIAAFLTAFICWQTGEDKDIHTTDIVSDTSVWFATDDELVDYVRPMVVMVTAGENHASGVIADISEDYVTVFTAGHLMEGYDQGIITFYTGNAGFGDVCYVSENPDLCIMTFATKFIDDSLLEKLSAARIDRNAYNRISEGDVVYLAGSALSTGSNVTKGTIASPDFYMAEFDARMLYLYADVMAGMSGCPTFDENGYLLGLLCAGTESGEAVCVKLADIIDKWEEIKR